MQFEGSEKKFKLIINDPGLNFLKLPDSYWYGLVAASNGSILSKLQTDNCKCFVLSESSLFVWPQTIIMSTCGRSKLVDSAVHLLSSLPPKKISSFLFERKNELFPHLQLSTFQQDADQLRQVIPGAGHRLGPADDHHMFFFNQATPYAPVPSDTTLEVLLYQLDAAIGAKLSDPATNAEAIEQILGLKKLFPGYRTDDYLFKPYGYSVNGVLEEAYFTVHITPQAESSYVGFEAFPVAPVKAQSLVYALVSRLKPQSFDVVYFTPLANKSRLELRFDNFTTKSYFQEAYESGYNVSFHHFLDTGTFKGKG